MTTRDHLDFKGVLILLFLTLLWGINYPAIKISNEGFSPIFNSFLRSAIASAFGVVYCLRLKEPLFHWDIRLFHGFMVGLLFGLEFVCLYLGMRYTDSARAVILVNMSPFVVVIGAFFFLSEKLTLSKIIGLVLAFGGFYMVFSGKPKTWTPSMVWGDILEIVAAFFWGATTVYIKKYLAGKMHPINTFLYQLVFSVPITFICALIFEEKWILDLSTAIFGALFYTSIIVAFMSYLAWFKLIYIYPVSELAVFTFLTPIFGVAASSVILGEQLTIGLLAGLACVSVGIYVTNSRRRS